MNKARLGPALMTVLILLCQTVLPADAAQLMYIRVGEYESMTRLVFEFDGKVMFKGPQIRGPGRVEVDFIERCQSIRFFRKCGTIQNTLKKSSLSRTNPS